ncbi:amino acid adenylation domain-containing protein [Streptomyces sp. NPDC056486]|uniref:amino acid adenylation domain-containing protein n=1 Tax=Streptomyces sp. NPDC056486 TaxID=3345835 RepID=UPI0036B61858
MNPQAPLADTLAGLTPQQRARLTLELARRKAAKNPAIPAQARTADGEQTFPASPGQERLWYLHALEPDSTAYVLPIVLRLGGAVDTAALQGALSKLVRRHEVLRTVFREDADGLIQQVVRPPDEVPLPVTGLAPGVSDDALWERVRGETVHPFDLATGPLVRASLLRRTPTEWVLVLCVHHIVVDGWSLGVLVGEIAETYAACAEQRAPQLPELSVQYADFAVWQRERLSGEQPAEHLTYWRGHLGGAPVLDVPGDRPRAAEQSFAGDSVPLELPAALVGRLTRLAESESATLFMGLLAGFSAVLGRWAGQPDVVVGTPVAGRTRTELEPLVGFFVNTLALRVDVGGGASFREVVRRARQTALDGFAHQEVPFERVVQELGVERGSSHPPVAQVMLALRNVPMNPPTLGDLNVEVVELPRPVAQLDLSVELAPTPEGGLTGALEFSSELYDRATARRLAAGVVALLDAAVEDPEAPVAHLDTVGTQERAQLRTFGGRDIEPFAPALLHELIERRVDADPAAVAVCGDGSGDNWSYSYGELDERANRVAWWLRARGVGAESLVGVCLERGHDLVPVLLGVLKAGAAYLPLDPSYPADRIGQLVADGRPALVLTSAGADAVLAGMAATDADIVVRVEDIADDLAQQPATRPAVPLHPLNGLCMLYTSGSTGRPKGTLLHHHALTNRLRGMVDQYRFHAGDRVLHKSPLGFDPHLWECFVPLMTGARVVMAAPGGHRDPGYLLDLCERARITCADVVPSMLRALLGHGGLDARAAGLRLMLCGGEELPPDLAAEFVRRLPGAELHNMYGPSETTIDATTHHLTAPVPEGRVSIGRPVPGSRVYILDAALHEQPVGVPGELCVGGVPLARGYHARPGLTADRFVPSPFEEGERLYRTGDLARWRHDGTVEYLGRLDNQIKIRGQRIEPAEVEAALLDHPAVDQALVTTEPGADGAAQLVAHLTGTGALDAAELRGFLAERLPAAMLPGSLVRLDAFPLLANGKVDLKALPTAPGERLVTVTAYEPPRDALEEVLAGIWADVLKAERVGAQDDFYDLGGHSLLATQVVSRITAMLRVEVPLRAFVGVSTVRRLAAVVRQTARGEGLDVDQIAGLVLQISGLAADEITQQLKD